MNVEPSERHEPRVSIAIVATNEQENIVGCLKALDKLLYRNFNVIICENGGPDAFARDIEEVSGIAGIREAPAGPSPVLPGVAEERGLRIGADGRTVRVLRAGANLGYSGGVNACIAAADDDYDFIWVLNPDTFPEPDALGALVRRQAEGGFGIVGSRLVYVGSNRVQMMGGLKYMPLLGRCRSLGLGAALDETPDVEKVEADLDIVSGASMFVAKDYIKGVGVMDEDFFVYFEDSEWSMRRGSFRLGYAHDSVVRHIAGAKSGSDGARAEQSRFSLYLTERNRVLIARKLHPRTWPVNAAATFLTVSEYLIRFRSRRAFKIALGGWWAGVRGETGMPGFMRGRTVAAAALYGRAPA